ncbi:hypothetical protein J3R82DRAFT_6696, partial [Butyriboletus roseoflavus]
QKQCQILRSNSHEIIPYFRGQWFPCAHETDNLALYHISTLALFKPWRDLAKLKQSTVTFQEAYEQF